MVVGAHAVPLAFDLHLLPFQVERGLNEMLHRKRVKIPVGIVPSVPESRLPDSYPNDEHRFLWQSESTSAIRLLIKRLLPFAKRFVWDHPQLHEHVLLPETTLCLLSLECSSPLG